MVETYYWFFNAIKMDIIEINQKDIKLFQTGVWNLSLHMIYCG